jgi:hypothetical protein
VNHPHPIYRKLARLSIAVGVLSTVAAVAFSAALEVIVPPHDPYRARFLCLGLAQISTFAFIAGVAPAAFARIHPATQRLARIGLLWSLAPFFAGALIPGLALWIVRQI